MSVVEKRTNEIRDFLFKWMKSVITKYPVVFDDQHEPRPTGPYISFKLLTNFTKIGAIDEKRFVQSENAWYRIGQRAFTVSIKATGSPIDGTVASRVKATDLLGEIQWKFDDQAAHDSFRAVGLSVIEAMSVIDTTELEENQFIPKAVLDVRMLTRIVEKMTIVPIESVEISGTISNPDATLNTTYGPKVVEEVP